MEVIVAGSQATVSYKEPTTNKNGSPLTDLANTSIFKTIGGTKTKVLDIPATAPTGGGEISQTIDLAVGADEEVDVTITANATDLGGNSSDPATDPSKTVRIDNLPPASPV